MLCQWSVAARRAPTVDFPCIKPHCWAEDRKTENDESVVQKFALRACTRNWKSDYSTLLERCKVPTLAQRRQFMKLCFMYLVINQLVVFPPEFIERRTLSRSLRNSSVFDLQRPTCRTSAHQFSFFPHTVRLWNNLPPEVQSCGSLTTFKSNLPI